MFHNGRSGSTVLGDLLDQHSQFLWDGEIMKPPRWKKPGDLRSFLLWSLFLTRADYYGFESKFFHVHFHGYDMGDYISMLEDIGFNKHVVLRRKNYLRGLLSALASRGEANKHISISTTPKLKKVHVNVDLIRYHKEKSSLLAQLERLNKDWQNLEKHLSGRQTLWLSYEDHVFENPVTAYKLVCDFLGLEQQPVSVRLGKTNPFPVKDMIANYDEVADVLTGTAYEHMLTD